MRTSAWWVLGSLALAACGGEESARDRAAGDTTVEAARAGALPVGGVHRVTGEFLVGTDRRDFLPCEGGPAYWVDGPALPDLMTLFQELTPGIEPYESVFVDLLADLDPAPPSGPGASLAGTVLALELRRVAPEGTCRGADSTVVAAARGNEPFWLLEATPGGVRWETPDASGSWQADRPLGPSPEGWTLSGTTHQGAPFTLTLELGGCRDSMSGAWFHLAAALQAGETPYQGCGWLGPAGEM